MRMTEFVRWNEYRVPGTGYRVDGTQNPTASISRILDGFHDY
jgi:hypothetical protein